MKNKIAAVELLMLLIVFHIINGKYMVIAPIIYLISFVSIQIKKKEFQKKDFLFGIACLIIEVLMLNKILNDYITSIQIKNIFSAFAIVIYTYIFADKDFTLKLYKKLKKNFKKINMQWEKLITNKKILWILPNNLLIFVCLILSIYTIISFSYKTANDHYIIYSQTANTGYIELLNKTKIKLNFTKPISNNDKFTHICFTFGTFKRQNKGKLTFILRSDKKTITKQTINIEKLNDAQTKCFNTKKISLENLKNADIFFIPNAKIKKGNSVALIKDQKTGNVSFTLTKMQKSNVSKVKKILIVGSIIIYIYINYLINKKKISYEKFYIYCILYILPLTFIFPAFTIPDEPHHFYRAYANSQIVDEKFEFKGLDNPITKIPNNIECLNYTSVQIADKILDINDIKNCAKEGKNNSIYNTAAGAKPLFGYIPQAIGIKIIDLFTNSPLYIFYFGRMFTAITSLVIIYFAIKITPKYKSIFIVVATMMMFIQQMISFSYDSILNAASLLLVAYEIKLMCNKEKIKLRDLIIPLIFYSIIINIKPVYIPIGIIMFFIPKEKFHKNKYIYIITFFIMTLSIIKITDLLVSAGTQNGIMENLITTDASKQLTYIINHPIHIIKVIYKTMEAKLMFYLSSLIGQFGWLKFKINDAYIIAYFLLILYITLGEKNILNKKSRIILFLSIMLSIVGIFGAMYLLWTDYKALIVDGVQGRYFIPLLIPLILCFIPKIEKYKLNKKAIYFSINILLLQFILTIIIWYF